MFVATQHQYIYMLKRHSPPVLEHSGNPGSMYVHIELRTNGVLLFVILPIDENRLNPTHTSAVTSGPQYFWPQVSIGSLTVILQYGCRRPLPTEM